MTDFLIRKVESLISPHYPCVASLECWDGSYLVIVCFEGTPIIMGIFSVPYCMEQDSLDKYLKGECEVIIKEIRNRERYN